MEGILRAQQEKSVERRLSGGGFASLPDSFHYALTDDDFARVRGLIYRLAGISLAPGKFDMVYSRLARRLRVRGLESFAHYLRLVEMGDEEESEAFINALTTNMTSFFREPHHFRMLAERLAKRGGRPVSIWSCASSSGEEPYSIAMTALETLNDTSGLDILASDIDTAVLAKARQGIYPIDQLAKVPLHLRKRFFMRGEGKNDGFARVKEELRQPITFRRMNLLDEKWPIHGKFDFVFCRNVMIYFDRETQHAILKRIARVLNPDGLLFVGHSESFHHTQELFKLCGTTAYALRG